MKLSTNEKSEIISLYLQGESSVKLGVQFDCSAANILKLLKKSGIERRQIYKLSDDDIKEIIEQRLSGDSLQKIAKRYNVSDVAILKTIKKNQKIFMDFSINYETSQILSYKDKLLTKHNILKMSKEEKEDVANFLFNYFRQNGFPYPRCKENELQNDWKNLKNFKSADIVLENENLSIKPDAGTKLFKHFFPHFYESKKSGKMKSLVDAFHDDKLLMKTINNRLGITWNEHFNITGNMLRQGLRNSHSASHVSVFKAPIAKFIYDELAPDNGIIYDYSSGFGQRMLGAISSNKNLTYIGVDPYQKSIDSCIEMVKFLEKEDKVQMHAVGSEFFCPSELQGKVDLAFSSPPYFSMEEYCADSTQAIYNRDYNQFINEWWNQTAQNIYMLIRPGGIMAINMMEKIDKNNILEDMLGILKTAGFKEIKRYNMQLTYNKAFKTSRDYFKTEPIVILQK